MKAKFILLTLCFCCFNIVAKAETTSVKGDVPTGLTFDFTKDGCYYTIISISDQTVELTCNNVDAYTPVSTYSGNFRVPETVEYSNRIYTVISIHKYAFYNSVFDTLTIPATIQKIGTGNITPVYGGTCHTLIVEDSKSPLEYHYDALKQVYDSVYLGRNLIGNYSIIDDYSFFDSYTGTYYGGEYRVITFGEEVTKLSNLCVNCKNLTSVTLPASINSLNGTFVGCKNLKLVNGEGVETINNAFSRSGIESINMPNLKMMEGDFQNCTSLQTFNIPEGAISLGQSEYSGLFTNATSLTSVFIPSTVISIGQHCFSGCTALQTISVANPNPIEINENNFDALTYLNATLKVPVGSKTKYMYAPVWSNFLNIVEDPSLVATSATVVINVIEEGYYYGGNTNYAFSEEGSTYQESEWGTTYNIVPVGCTMTITVQPQENYLLSSLTINGEDVTANVVNNEYSIVINGSATYSINAEFEYNDTPQPQGEYVSIVYVDKDSEYIDSQSVTLYLPEAPEIEGFTFVGWQPVAAIIEETITIQAIYKADEPSTAPTVYTNPANHAQKLIRNGNVYILTDDKFYTITGQKVK